jgi:homoserine O-acetyltransferase/O-succinyltransferase
LEWSINQPSLFESICLLATNAKEPNWGISMHEAHKQALRNDPTFINGTSGSNGLKTSRGLGMIIYRSYESYQKLQAESEVNKTNDFKAVSCIRYQSEKFEQRFSPFSYYHLLNAYLMQWIVIT